MIIVDIIIALLLIITIWFCFKLNRKIVDLQKGKKDLAILFKYFDNAIKRAEEGIEHLKENTDHAKSILDKKINEANIAADDIAFFIEKSQKTLKNLEELHAKLIMKENFLAQDNIIKKSNTTPEIPETPKYSMNQNIATSMNPIEQGNINNSKRIAIETLLDKISEIQRRSKQNA